MYILFAKEFLDRLKSLGQIHSSLQVLLKAKQKLVFLKQVVFCKGYSLKKCVPIYLITLWFKQHFFKNILF